MSGPSKNIRVVVRVRPPNTREMEQNQRPIIKCQSHGRLIFDPDEEEEDFFYHGSKQFYRDVTRKQNKKLLMEFDEIFDDQCCNEDVFETAMKPLVHSVMDGFNCSAFVYGATGAGKTHTMLGNEHQPGITFLTMSYLFDRMDSLQADRKFEIYINYMEVYNEQVMNLLSKGDPPLKLREDPTGGVVSGLKPHRIFNAEGLFSLLAQGNRNRTQHPTDANAESSRSHAIFQVLIRMEHLSSGQKNRVKLSMIDLAGSERAASTKGVGMRFKEGASINKSLLALGNCINKLADGAKHIPYRDSNLTRIIKDSLGGNCQTVMIANVSPSSLTYEDTYNTLKYASRAKKIRSQAKLNVCKNNTPKDVLVKQISDQHEELLSLREQVRHLEARLAAAESSPKTAQIAAMAANSKMSSADLAAELTPWYARIDEIYKAMGNLMECSMHIDSNDKIKQFRTEIRQYGDTAMQGLVLDGRSVKADLAWASASVDQNKQNKTQRQNVEQYRDRVAEKRLELKKLKRELSKSNYEDQLTRYLIGKECELKALQKDLKNMHLMQINRIYNGEVHHLLNVLKLGNNIIQENYYLLRANDMLDINMREDLERLKRLGRGRRDRSEVSSPVVVPTTAAHLAVSAGGVSGDGLDRFNITMADPGGEAVADDDDDDADYEDVDSPDAVQLNSTVALGPAPPKRRNRSSTSGGGAGGGLPNAAADQQPLKKPVKKLFKADSSSVRNAMLAKSSTSAAAAGRVQPALPPRASVHASSAAAMRSQFNDTHVLSGNDWGATMLASSSDMEVDSATAVVNPFETPTSLNEKGSQIKSKATLLKSILKENAASTLYQKVSKINPKAVVSGSKTIGTLNKENKRSSPVRVSPRSKQLPRQNNASRARQRMLTASASVESTAASLKNKFKVIPTK